MLKIFGKLRSFLSQSFWTSLALLIFVVNTIFCFLCVFLCALLKALVPIKGFKDFLSGILVMIADFWIAVNNFNMSFTQGIVWEIQGLEKIKKNDWYFVFANHQSAFDILALQKVFQKKIPFLKFFIKKELLWLPILGQCWWALDFPFMKRKKKGSKKSQDFNTIRRTCAKLNEKPSTIISFLEGTRFSQQKHQTQMSKFNSLLRPKAGGFGLVMETMGQKLNKLIDVTIYYPEGAQSILALFCGKIKRVVINIKYIEMTPELIGKYEIDPEYRKQLQSFLNKLWSEKDSLLSELKKNSFEYHKIR